MGGGERSEPTLQDKFKLIKDLAESGMYKRDQKAMWIAADLILSLAQSIMRRIEEEKEKK